MTNATSIPGPSTTQELFALTDEQILGIEPQTHDVEAGAARGAASAPGGDTDEAPSAREAVVLSGSDAQAPVPGTNSAAQATQINNTPFSAPEDVRALAELYPGGLNQARSAADRARTLDEIDAAYFGGEGNSPEQISAARAQLAQRMLREDPAAFREMVFAGLRALEDVGRANGQPDANVAPPFRLASVSTNRQTATQDARSPVSPNATVGAQHAAPHLATSSANGADAHLAAYAAFEKAANNDLERSVGGAIDRALQHALPNLGKSDVSRGVGAQHVAPLQARLSAAIRDDIEKALQADRQLGEQVAQIVSSRRFDNATRAQVVRLINDRALQLVPGAAKRALNDWTQATLATHRARARNSEANASHADVLPAAGQGIHPSAASANTATSARTEKGRGAASHSGHSGQQRSPRVDYRKLTDDQILDL